MPFQEHGGNWLNICIYAIAWVDRTWGTPPIPGIRTPNTSGVCLCGHEESSSSGLRTQRTKPLKGRTICIPFEPREAKTHLSRLQDEWRKLFALSSQIFKSLLENSGGKISSLVSREMGCLSHGHLQQVNFLTVCNLPINLFEHQLP